MPRKKTKRRASSKPNVLLRAFLISLVINFFFAGFFYYYFFKRNTVDKPVYLEHAEPKTKTSFRDVIQKKIPRFGKNKQEREVVTQKPAPVKKTPPQPNPKVQELKTRTYPVPQPSQVLKEGKPKIAFVIDDMGNSRRNESLFRELGDKVTYAVLPFLPYSEHFSELSRKTNADVILHLPLEAKGGVFPGPGLLQIGMSEGNLLDLLDRNLQTVPDYVGMNSHMGSLGTTDEKLMRTVLEEAKRRNIFFLDSYTTSDSVIQKVGKGLGLNIMTRDTFLDNVDDQTEIRKQIYRLATLAQKNGHAIGIGHDRYNTLQVLIDVIPILEEEGFEIVPLLDLKYYLHGKST